MKLTRQQRIAKFRTYTKNVRTSTTIGLFFCSAVAAGLFITSFFVPPTGKIDESVLKASGALLTFAALFFLREAVLEGMGIKLTHGDTTIEVKDQDGNNETIKIEQE